MTRGAPGPWRWVRGDGLRAENGQLVLRDGKNVDPLSPDGMLLAGSVSMATALDEIEKIPPAPFSTDQLEHANRTIEEMRRIAREALVAVGWRQPRVVGACGCDWACVDCGAGEIVGTATGGHHHLHWRCGRTP